MALQFTDPTQLKKLEATFQEMKKKAENDPVYFVDTFLYMFDPKNEPHNVPFKTFDFQKRLIRQLVKHIRNGDDIFIEKCREMGATYTVLAVFLWLWLFQPSSSFLIGSRKEDYVDNRRGGITGNKEESLFGKLDYMITRLSPFMFPEGWDRNKHFNYMSLMNPDNGNVISGESSNPNFSRGGRHTAILLDEFAFWDTGSAAWGSTADTTNCRVVLTTPGSSPSKAKRLRYGKDGEEIKVVTLSYHLDPRKTSSWLEKERRRRSSEDFNREIMINWELSITGRVYPEVDNAAVGDYPFLLNEHLYCSWDFGLDGTALLFWQRNKANGKWRMIDSYFNQNQPIQFYFPLFGQAIESKFTYGDDDLKAITEISQYPRCIHFGDPDVKKRAFQTDAISTQSALNKAGIYVQTIPAKTWQFRRDVTKVFLQDGIEINLNPRTEFAYECFKYDRYKERPQDVEYTSPPQRVHGIESHLATAMEYFAVNINAFDQNQQEETPGWAMQPKKWLTNKLNLRR
jgi:hypothetical protein